MVGLTHAQAALAHAVQLPILHLGNVNQYVSAMMARSDGAWAASRQPAVLPRASGGQPICGVSAFAFQGTNAHVLLGLASAPEGLAAPGLAPTWQRQRQWVCPPAHR